MPAHYAIALRSSMLFVPSSRELRLGGRASGYSPGRMALIAGCTRIIDDRNENLRDRARAYNIRGLVRFQTDDYDGAIADYDQAIKLDPQFAAAYYNRGLAHEDKGSRNLAIADLKRAIGLGHQLAGEELRKLGVTRQYSAPWSAATKRRRLLLI